MRADLNSPAFGIGIPSNLGLGITDIQGESIEGVVNGNISVQMNYGQYHEQFSKQLFAEAGGEERYDINCCFLFQGKFYALYTNLLFACIAIADCSFNTSFTLHISSTSGLQIEGTRQ